MPWYLTPFQWKSKTSLSQCSIGPLVPINQSIFYPGIQGIVFLGLFCAQLHNTTRHPSGPLMVPHCQGKPLPLNSIEVTLSRPVQKKVDLRIRSLHGAGGVDYFSQWIGRMELNVSSPTILPLNVGSETDMFCLLVEAIVVLAFGTFGKIPSNMLIDLLVFQGTAWP